MTVDEYIAAAGERGETLRVLRDLVRETVPQAREELRHRMPYYEHHGDLAAFAAQKNYFSFYVMSRDVPLGDVEELASLAVGKSCIRFKRLDEVPLDTLRRLVAAGARANERGASA